jgi:hypothetical protein
MTRIHEPTHQGHDWEDWDQQQQHHADRDHNAHLHEHDEREPTPCGQQESDPADPSLPATDDRRPAVARDDDHAPSRLSHFGLSERSHSVATRHLLPGVLPEASG